MLNVRNSYSGLRGQASLSKILNRVTCHIVSSCDFCAFTLHTSRDLLARSTAPRQLSLLRSRRICTLPASYHATKRLFHVISLSVHTLPQSRDNLKTWEDGLRADSFLDVSSFNCGYPRERCVIDRWTRVIEKTH